MNTTNNILSTNSIAFIALAGEYCHLVESAQSVEKEEFVKRALNLLPRLYITATDLKEDAVSDDFLIEPVIDETAYNHIRNTVEAIMGEDDTYLEVFEEDMKYSDTPIGASVSEGVADLYQVMFNFISGMRNATDVLMAGLVMAMHEDFELYWSRILCNLLRALNHIRYFA